MNVINFVLEIDDILGKIFTFVNCGSGFKNILFTCKKWNMQMLSIYPRGHLIFANHLLTLMKLYPYKPWDYGELSANFSLCEIRPGIL